MFKLFRKADSVPEPPYSPPGTDSTWQPLDYNWPEGMLINGRIENVHCRRCKAETHPDWSLFNGAVMIRPKPCPSCGA
jgi:hypothetical protein